MRLFGFDYVHPPRVASGELLEVFERDVGVTFTDGLRATLDAVGVAHRGVAVDLARYVARDDTRPRLAPSDVAAAAARGCLDRAGVAPTAVDGLVVSTNGPDYLLPSQS